MIEADRVREAAEEVLRRPEYADLRDNPLQRAVTEVRSWIAEQLFDLLGGDAAAGIGLVIAVVLVGAVVGLGVVALLGAQRRATADLVVDDVKGATVDEALSAAAAARAAGDLQAAVRLRYGALLLTLEERGVVPRVPGLTVGEVDAAVTASVPAAAAAVTAAGDALADIVYGHRAAAHGDDDVVSTALRAVQEAAPLPPVRA